MPLRVVGGAPRWRAFRAWLGSWGDVQNEMAQSLLWLLVVCVTDSAAESSHM